MKDRMTLGHIADVAESAALTMADGRATERIVEACNGEVGRVGRARRVGQWFLEICFRSFAQDLAKHLQGALRIEFLMR